MAAVWIVRHAVTAENLCHVLVGRTDPALHVLGRRQARFLSQRLQNQPLDTIFTSPLRRALDTARAIARYHQSTPLEVMEGLCEIDLGIVDGLSSFDAYERFTDVFEEALDQNRSDFHFPGGESWSDALNRFSSCIDRMRRAYPEGRICVVTHGGPIGLWLAKLHNLPLGMFRSCQPAHASITHVEVNSDQTRLHSFSEDSYIPDSLRQAVKRIRNNAP